MHDRSQSTPYADFDPDAALREIYAVMLRPEDRELLAALCASVLTLTREAPVFSGGIPGGMVANLRAASTELRHLAVYLAYTGASEGNELSRAESRLGDTAEALGARVAEVAGELDAGIAAALSSLPN
jgi:hypothetical protein